MATTIQISESAKKVLRDLQDKSAIATAVAAGMEKQNALTVSHIQRAHLTGRGPFPPEEHKLGVRSGRLRSSLVATAPTVSGAVAESSIGSNVVYAAIHEFGGRIKRKPYSGKVRLRTGPAGLLMSQPGYEHLAVFAKRSHKQAKEVSFSSGGYETNMPERSPVRTGISEKLDSYGRRISAAILEAWKQ